MLKLTFPRTHTISDIEPLFYQFKREYPDVYDEWYNWTLTNFRENRHFDDVQPEARRRSIALNNFIPLVTECTSPDALTSAMSDFNKIMFDIVREQIAREKGVKP